MLSDDKYFLSLYSILEYQYQQRDLEEREIISFLWSITSKEKKVDNSIFQLVLIFTVLKNWFFGQKTLKDQKFQKPLLLQSCLVCHFEHL